MRTILLVFILLVCGCDRTDYSINTLGKPTPLNGRTPIETLCSIQHEFQKLTKPVLAHVSYHKKDSRKQQVEFHFTKEKLPDYYQFTLTDEAQTWVKQHTHAEISASLMPLILDPVVGGEAAIVLTSLASNRTFRSKSYGRHTSQIASSISKFMYETGYREPNIKGNWDREYAHNFSVPREIWLSYLFPDERKSYSYDDNSGLLTLNAYLTRLQFDITYYENGLVLRYEDDKFIKTETLSEWSEKNPLPPIPDMEKHNALINKYGQALTILGSYTGWLPSGLAIYELGKNEYWPLLYNQTHTVKELYGKLGKHHEYREKYIHEVRETVYEYSQRICDE